MSLNGKMALVTGAGSGIGKAIATMMAERGAAVAVVDLDQAAIDQVVEAIGKGNGRAAGFVAGFVADVSDKTQIDAAVSAAVEELGPLDIMVNNAGILDGYLDVDKMDESIWRRVIDVDLTGVFLGCKRALDEMLPRGSGRIINMASAAGLNGTGGGAAYIAAKHGVVGLTRQMAVVYSHTGITVNSVCPGPIPTDLRSHSQDALPTAPDMSRSGVAVTDAQVEQLIPAKRRGSVDDIASAVCFLASDEAGYITGHALSVDGGWRAR